MGNTRAAVTGFLVGAVVMLLPSALHDALTHGSCPKGSSRLQPLVLPDPHSLTESRPHGPPCPDGYPAAVSLTVPSFNLCLHPRGDAISDYFWNHGMWDDCKPLPDYLDAVRTVYNLSHLNVLDVGGNIGSCTMHMASRGVNVTVFEPSRRNYERLEGSIGVNGFADRITLVKSAAGSTDRETNILSEVWSGGGANYGNSVINLKGTDPEALFHGRKSRWVEEEVSIRRIDSFVHHHVHFAKMDCQGHEFEALLGATELLGHHGVDVIRAEFDPQFIAQSGHSGVEFLRFLARHNYKLQAEGVEIHAQQFSAFEEKATRLSKERRPVPEVFAINRQTIPEKHHKRFQ